MNYIKSISENLRDVEAFLVFKYFKRERERRYNIARVLDTTYSSL
jgi:hypothetical protein